MMGFGVGQTRGITRYCTLKTKNKTKQTYENETTYEQEVGLYPVLSRCSRINRACLIHPVSDRNLTRKFCQSLFLKKFRCASPPVIYIAIHDAARQRGKKQIATLRNKGNFCWHQCRDLTDLFDRKPNIFISPVL